MYIVQWDDHTGQRQQLAFDTLEDAQLEAQALEKKFDFVQIEKEDDPCLPQG